MGQVPKAAVCGDVVFQCILCTPLLFSKPALQRSKAVLERNPIHFQGAAGAQSQGLSIHPATSGKAI